MTAPRFHAVPAPPADARARAEQRAGRVARLRRHYWFNDPATIAALLVAPVGIAGALTLDGSAEATAVVALSASASVAGALATWLFRGERYRARAERDDAARETIAYERNLDVLFHRLRGDNDTRPEQLLIDLRAVRHKLYEAPCKAGQEGLRDGANEAFGLCVGLLRQTADLADEARALGPSAERSRLAGRREELLREVRVTAEKLAALAESFAASSGGGCAAVDELRRLRDDLEQNAEVARRVEERMREFDSSAERTRV